MDKELERILEDCNSINDIKEILSEIINFYVELGSELDVFKANLHNVASHVGMIEEILGSASSKILKERFSIMN